MIQFYGSIESILANTVCKPRPDFAYDRARRVFDRAPDVPLDPEVYQPKPEIQPLLLELLLKYDINPEEVKQDLWKEMKEDEAAANAGCKQAPGFAGEGSGTFAGNSMGVDPFKASVVDFPSFTSSPNHPTL